MQSYSNELPVIKMSLSLRMHVVRMIHVASCRAMHAVSPQAQRLNALLALNDSMFWPWQIGAKSCRELEVDSEPGLLA